ncbi:MAG: MaoC family dehydratase N-terminal domain-containing protein [Rhodospirillaceae bacterium]|nr:MaoC family dehydratase N-terminal domain-containing protein [Rhodospirillaceae bacterium]
MTAPGESAPTTYWEDIRPGQVRQGGAFAFDTAAIKRFAAEFDPRPTHLDEAAAAATFFKGLAASGTHTFAAWARLYWEITPDWSGEQAGAQMDKMRLFRPVRPGDVLSLRMTVVGTRPNPLRAGFGFVDTRHELFNQEGKPVMALDCTIMIARRPPATPDRAG